MKNKRVVIVPYNIGSQSAKGLQEVLQSILAIPVIRVRRDSTKYQPRYTDYIINWGCATPWQFITPNQFQGNQVVVDKLKFFQNIHKHNEANPDTQVNIPEWTTDKKVAETWAKQDTVVGRKILNGHSGKGIELYDANTPVEYCPLYTKYKKKRNEYRVHVFKGEVIDIVQKKKKKGIENVDTKIRSHLRGWVFCRENIYEPEGLRQQAINALAASNLVFGAVDIIWNEAENQCYVIEVNSAPGIEGTTLLSYVRAFLKDMK